MEIALLKEMFGNTKDSDPQRLIPEFPLHRDKRPVRLLPDHILYRQRKNQTEHQQQFNHRRYEQPTNCSDLFILGYTLNGFYLVKSNDTTNIEIKLDTIYCAFKQPGATFDPSLVEKRIISRRDTNKIVFQVERSTDLEAESMKSLIFDVTNLNTEKAFNVETGTYTIPKSGLYLFVFRGLVIFPQQNSKIEKQMWVYITKNGTNIGSEEIVTKNQSYYAELDKLVKGNRGDMISVAAFFYIRQRGVKFSSSSTSFAGYLLEE